jgi:integration host factor subunit beta
MKRSELIALMAAKNEHLTVEEIESVIDTIFNGITATLIAGGRVELRDFGIFTVKRRNARSARNPRSGDSVSVAAKAFPFFKAGKKLRDRANQAKKAPKKARARTKVAAQS